jgi:hypothetical protein
LLVELRAVVEDDEERVGVELGERVGDGRVERLAGEAQVKNEVDGGGGRYARLSDWSEQGYGLGGDMLTCDSSRPDDECDDAHDDTVGSVDMGIPTKKLRRHYRYAMNIKDHNNAHVIYHGTHDDHVARCGSCEPHL